MRTDVQLGVPSGELVRKGRPTGGRRHDAEELGRFKQVAKEFEAVLLEQMVKEMRSGEVKSNLFGKDSGMETYKEMLDGEYVRLMSERGGIGLADFMVQNPPPGIAGKSVSTKALKAAKAAGAELDRISSFVGNSRQSLQTGLPTLGAWGVNGGLGD